MVFRLLLVCALFFAADALIWESARHVGYNSSFIHVVKFCFAQKDGTINLKIEDTNATHTDQYVLLFHDMETLPGGYAGIAVTGQSCNYKKNHAANRIPFNDPAMNSPAGKTLRVTSNYRERWWFVAIVSCTEAPADADIPFFSHIDIPYLKVTMLNNGNSYPQFSYDEIGIYEIQIVALVALMGLMVGCGYKFKQLIKDEGQKLHQVVFMLLCVFTMKFIATCMEINYWDTYKSSGKPTELIRSVASVFGVFPDSVLLTLFILISKGWQINEASFQRIPAAAKRSSIEFVVIYTALSVIMQAWSGEDEIPFRPYHTFLSPPGYILCALHIVVGLWFASNLFSTQRKARASTGTMVYVLFGVLGLAYILMFPLAVCIGYMSDDFNRAKIVEIFSTVTDLVVYGCLFGIFGVNSQMLKKDLNDMRTMVGQQDSDFDDGMIMPAVAHADADTRGSEFGETGDSDEEQAF